MSETTATILRFTEQFICLKLATACRPCQLTNTISTAMHCASEVYKVRSGGNCQFNPQTFTFTIHYHLLIEKVGSYINGKRVVIAHDSF
jgi:hypothetical protein